jgi:Rrf2 family transcriptional regulator, cysteine metabolism repressor
VIISTRGRYGLSAMIEIASIQNNKAITIKKISKNQGISESYLEQLIIPLKKSGYIKSFRGAAGGYTINCDASLVTVGDILKVLEGPMYPVDCIGEESKKSFCGISSCKTCVTKPVWEELYQSLSNVLESFTLEDLSKNYVNLNLDKN